MFTERCVMKLTPEGVVLTEIAPGVDLETDILGQSEFPLIVSDALKPMDPAAVRRGADRPDAARQGTAPSREATMTDERIRIDFDGP